MFSGLARKAKAKPQSQTRGRRTRQNNTLHYKQPQYLEPSQAKIRKVKQAKARQGRGRRTTWTQDTRASPRADRPYSRKAQMTPEHQEPRKLWGCGLYPRPFGRQSGTDKRTTNTKQWQSSTEKGSIFPGKGKTMQKKGQRGTEKEKNPGPALAF